MARQIPATKLKEIENIVRQQADNASAGEIAASMEPPVSPRSLQYWLKHLADTGRLVKVGERRGAKYHLAAGGPANEATGRVQPAETGATPSKVEEDGAIPAPLSTE